jgi:hypothetical protein
MIQKISTIVGWLALAFIAYATLSPIDDRPMIANVGLEHFAAFGLVGLALGRCVFGSKIVPASGHKGQRQSLVRAFGLLSLSQ